MTRSRIQNGVWKALGAAVMALALLIPLVRRYRRRPGWKWVRAGGWAASVVLIAVGGTAVQAAGVVLFALATLLGPAADPDGLRKLAEKLGARHVVNGGRLPSGNAVLLLITPEEVLLSPAATPERVETRYRLDSLEEIGVEGQSFRLRNYVSFAKEPPQRDSAVDRNATCGLVLSFAGAQLELEYTGAFAHHLAEIAAHTLYQCREAGRRTQAEALPVIQ